MKKNKGKETIGYAETVSERIVICETEEKGRKQERVENMEAKNLPNGISLTTIIYTLRLNQNNYRKSHTESLYDTMLQGIICYISD